MEPSTKALLHLLSPHEAQTCLAGFIVQHALLGPSLSRRGTKDCHYAHFPGLKQAQDRSRCLLFLIYPLYTLTHTRTLSLRALDVLWKGQLKRFQHSLGISTCLGGRVCMASPGLATLQTRAFQEPQ